MALALAGTHRLRSDQRHARQRRRRGGVAVDPGRCRAAAGGLRPGRGHLRRPRPTTAGTVEVKVSPTSDRLQLLEPFPRMGRQRLRGPPGPGEGAGQVHHRPHLDGRPVAQVPRPSREHLGQPVPRRGQRLNDGYEVGIGKNQLTGETPELPRHRQGLPRGRPALGGDRRREHGRGLEPRARRHGAPLPAAAWWPSPAASPASTRPT